MDKEPHNMIKRSVRILLLLWLAAVLLTTGNGIAEAAEKLTVGDTTGGDEIIFKGLVKRALANNGIGEKFDVEVVKIALPEAEEKLKSRTVDAVIVDGELEKVFKGVQPYLQYRYADAVPCLIVCSENPLSGVKSEELTAILSGKAGNWGFVGDFDRAIYLVAMDLNLPITKYFFNKILESRPPTEYIYQVKRLQELIIMAQNNAGTLGVGYFIGDVLPPGVKYLAVNGVLPSRKNIIDNTYPWKISRNLVWPKNSLRQNEIDQLIRSAVEILTVGDLVESSWILSSDLKDLPEKTAPESAAEKKRLVMTDNGESKQKTSPEPDDGAIIRVNTKIDGNTAENVPPVVEK